MADDVGHGRAANRWAWLSLVLAAWLIAGLALVSWALGQGLTRDFGMSPYHVPAYLGVLALATSCLWLVARAVRAGRPWPAAFAPGYGVLAAGAIVLLAYPVADVAWRDGVGFGGSGLQIEQWLAPSRILIPIGLVLVAAGPLRAALDVGGTVGARWAAVISAGLILSVLALVGGFQPAVNPWLERPPLSPLGATEVWEMEADGARQTRLIEADDSSSASIPSWSPDQTRFAYVHWQLAPDGQPDADIWLARADGTGRHLLVGSAGDWQWFPSWSPDGSWIVYTQEPEGGPGMSAGPVGPDAGAILQGFGFGPPIGSRAHAAIWRVRADGTGSPERLTDGSADDRAPVYSPDGTRLLFDSFRDGHTQIYVMNADGTGRHRLTQDDGEDWGASWSPDGARITFMSDYQIYVMNVDGTGRTRLTHDDTFYRSPTWSPDGARIAFEDQTTGKSAIWSMRTDGSDLRELSRTPEASTNLGGANGAWGRDGRLVYTRSADPPPTSAPVARQDLAAAAMLLEAVLVTLVALVLIRTTPPFGAFAIVLGLAAIVAASGTNGWRFVPAALAGGLVVDLLVRLAPPHRKASVAGAAAPAAFVLGSGITIAVTTGLAWSPTLLLGVSVAVAALGWGLAAVMTDQHGAAKRGTTT